MLTFIGPVDTLGGPRLGSGNIVYSEIQFKLAEMIWLEVLKPA